MRAEVRLIINKLGKDAMANRSKCVYLLKIGDEGFLSIKGAIPIFVNLFDAMLYSQMQALIFPEIAEKLELVIFDHKLDPEKAKSLVAISEKK